MRIQMQHLLYAHTCVCQLNISKQHRKCLCENNKQNHYHRRHTTVFKCLFRVRKHRDESPHKGPVIQKAFPCHNFIVLEIWRTGIWHISWNVRRVMLCCFELHLSCLICKQFMGTYSSCFLHWHWGICPRASGAILKDMCKINHERIINE